MVHRSFSHAPTLDAPGTAPNGSGIDLPIVSEQSQQVNYAAIGSGRFATLLAGFVLVVVLSSIGATKGVVLGPVITDGAFFLFPFAYILGDVITEVYGPRAARQAIITGFLANLIAVLFFALVIWLPGFDDDFGVAKQQALEVALGPVWQIVLASLLGFAAGQSANSFIMWLGKRRDHESRLYRRMISSTGVGEAIDTIIFCTIAAGVIGIDSLAQWANYVLFGYVWKVAVELLVMPITARVIGHFKRVEPSYRLATG
jgi:uncharacterized integral membrane protein (TIGR00697 family)